MEIYNNYSDVINKQLLFACKPNIGRGPLSYFHGVNVAEGRMQL